MGFKLIRIDCEEPTKIPLKVGTHVIGRGSFLNCDDHRVSRQHGVLNVTDSEVLLKSLHRNPCFYNKRELKKSALLPKGKSIQLSNSDHFGLLPDTYWYEIIFCDENQSNSPQVDEVSIETKTTNNNTEFNEETRVFTCYDNSGTQKVTYKDECDDVSDSESLNLEFDETMESERSELRSLLTNSNSNAAEDSSQTKPSHCETPGKRPHKPDQNNQAKKSKAGRRSQSGDVEQDSSLIPTNNDDDSQTFTSEDSHEPTNNDTESNNTDPLRLSMEVKKEIENPVIVKIEPLSPKKEKEPDVKPGPSKDKAGSSNDVDGAPKPPPVQPVRERCIYGSGCYSEPASTRRRVSFSQLEEMWEYLNKNRELATGFNKSAQARYECRRLWEKIADRLNSQGDGANKNWRGWCKYWADYKCKLKKMAQKASQSQVEGGPAKMLTDIEIKFISLLGNEIGRGLDGIRVEPFELTSDDTLPLTSMDTSTSPLRTTSPHSPPSSPLPTLHPVSTSPVLLITHTPRPLHPAPSPTRPSTSPPPHPFSSLPTLSTTEPQSSPPRVSPRRRRRRNNSSMSAEAARRAIIRETESRNDIERHRNEIMQCMLRELREIKQILR